MKKNRFVVFALLAGSLIVSSERAASGQSALEQLKQVDRTGWGSNYAGQSKTPEAIQKVRGYTSWNACVADVCVHYDHSFAGKGGKVVKLAGKDLGGEMGIHSAALGNLGAKIDQALGSSDMVGLLTSAIQLNYLETVTGKRSKDISSEQLVDTAAAILGDRSKTRFNPGEYTLVILAYDRIGAAKKAHHWTDALKQKQKETGFGFITDKDGYGYARHSNKDDAKGFASGVANPPPFFGYSGKGGRGSDDNGGYLYAGHPIDPEGYIRDGNGDGPGGRGYASTNGSTKGGDFKLLSYVEAIPLETTFGFAGKDVHYGVVTLAHKGNEILNVSIDGISLGTLSPGVASSYSVQPGTKILALTRASSKKVDSLKLEIAEGDSQVYDVR